MLKSLFDTFVPDEIKKTPLAYSHAKNIIRAAIITLIATQIYAMIYHVLDFQTVGLLFIILSLAYLFEIGKREYTAEIEITNEKLYAAKIEADKSAQHASEANRAKSTFLATMSHEIRTPLNGVLGMIGILIETPLTQEQYKQAEIIRSSGEALLAIINNILDFSKIESERLELEETNFDIYAVINNIIKMISAQIPSKNLAIISAIEPSTPRWLKGDCNRIGQVLNNLLMNAAKFTEVGEIRTSVRLLSQKNREITLLFEIIDTGNCYPLERR